jgi:hypothetical protein
VFYVETVDAAGNSVVYSTTGSLTINVSGATTSVAPLIIPTNAATTNPNTVTATLSSQNGTTSVVITAAGYTLNVKVTK